MTQRSVAIYALVDPRDLEIGYVGKTVLPLGVRLCNHICDARGRMDRRIRRWINDLLVDGVTPRIELIEEVCHDEWDEAERAWIEYFRSIGQAQANSHCGGQGGGHNRGRKMSEEQKRKISESLRGRPCTPAQLEALRAENARRKMEATK